MRRRLIQVIFIAILALVPMIVGAQSTVTASGFQVQNLSETAAANITVRYISSATGAEVASQNAVVPANGSLTFFNGQGGTVNMAAPAGFRGSVVIESDQPVVAITNLVNTGSPSAGESYSGFNAGSQSVSLPLVVRGNFGDNTVIVVQNAGTDATTVTISYTPTVGNAATEQATIQPGASRAFVQADNANLGTRFVGSATVTAATGGLIVATVVQEGNNKLLSYSGFNASLAPSPVAVPLIVSNNFGAFTGLQIQNNGTQSTTVTVTYSANTVTTPAGNIQPCGARTARTFTLTGGASVTTIHANGPQASGFDAQFANCRYVGGATVTSSNNQPLTAIVNQIAGPSGSAYEGFQVNSATSSVRVPLAVANNFGDFSGIQIQNVGGGATTATVTYGPNTVTGAGACPTPTARTFNLAGGAAVTTILAGGDAANGFDNQFATCRYVGSATITAASGGQVVAIANQISGLTDNLFTYSAFSQ